MKLRKYQKQDYKSVKKLLKEKDHIIFGASTGYGKSVIIHKFVKDALKKGERVIVIAPRRKLVKQLAETLDEFYPSIVMGADTDYDAEAELFVVSQATMINRLKKHGRAYFGHIDRILIDECHIGFNSKSAEILKQYYWETSKWVGLSATPIDSRGYRLEGWDYTMYEHQARDLIDMGFLTPIKVLVEEQPKGLDELKLTGGDYNESELSDFMMDGGRVSNVYKIYKKYALGRRVMVFAVTINHAEMIYNDFVRKGVRVGIAHSGLPESEEDGILEDFEQGYIDVLINVSKLTFGFDCPPVDCLIIARPSKSKALFYQIIGRALRLYEGKTEALILDVAGVIQEHGYPTAKYDYNKVKPPPKEKKEIEYQDSICDNCGYETQFKNCSRKVKETKAYTRTRWYCPECDEVMKELLVDNKEVKRLIEIADYTNTDKVTNSMVGKMIYSIAKRKKYKKGWIMFISKDYAKCPKLKEDMKIQYNRWKAKLCNLDTVLTNINKSREQYCG